MSYDDELKAEIAREAAAADKPLSAAERYEQGLLQSQRPVKAVADLAVPKLKPTAVEVLEPMASANARTFAHLEFTAEDAGVALALNINLDGALDTLVARAVTAINQAALRAVEAGYLLLKAKANVEHGQFETLVESAGLSSRRAQEMMRMAKVLTLAPATQRATMLELPKTKVMALASADQAVLEALMEDGADKIDALSVRELKAEIKSMKKALVDVQVQRDTAEAELTTARRKLHGREQRTDMVPNIVADTRQEIGAQAKKAELAIQSFGELLSELSGKTGVQGDWFDATARHGVAALAALRYQLDAMLSAYTETLGDPDPMPTSLSYMTQQEQVELHEKWRGLTAMHEYEKSMRAWERAQSRPKTAGRPMAKPTPPAAAE